MGLGCVGFELTRDHLGWNMSDFVREESSLRDVLTIEEVVRESGCLGGHVQSREIRNGAMS